MKVCILDASVAAKWVLPSEQEPYSAEAVVLLKKHTRGDIRFIVPDLFWPEIGNILWKCVRVQRITQGSAKEALALLERMAIRTVPSSPQAEHALSIALAFDRAVYDCIYLALAIHLGAAFVTADERLVNAVGSRFPISWLGNPTHSFN